MKASDHIWLEMKTNIHQFSEESEIFLYTSDAHNLGICRMNLTKADVVGRFINNQYRTDILAQMIRK